MRTSGHLHIGLLFLALISLPTERALANEIQLTAGLEGMDTSWQGDSAASGLARIAYRWERWSAYFIGKLGIAAVDERVLQHLEAGGERFFPVGRTRAFLRAGVTHRHEAPADSIEKDVGALFGYGDGIRHRGGLAAAAGWQLPFATHEQGDFFAQGELVGDFLVGAAGPRWSYGIGVALGFTYDRSGK